MSSDKTDDADETNDGANEKKVPPPKGKGKRTSTKPPLKFPNWTLEKIRALTDEQIKNLYINAEKNDVTDLMEVCVAVLDERTPIKNTKLESQFHYKKITRTKVDKTDEKTAARNLEDLANTLIQKYDLSKETAKQLTKAKIFPHSFLGKDGKAKIGGGQKNNSLIFDRYISYSLGGETFRLIALKFPSNKISYEVIAPKNWLSNPQHISVLRPYLQKGENIGRGEWGQQFDNFSEASGFFQAILNKIAPKKI